MDGDPEEWPLHPPELRQLDSSLRCAICQDIYTAPVALACGHTFCSRCIRDSLNVRIRDGQAQACPSCRKGCDQAALLPVSHLREACNAWRTVRHIFLQQYLQVQQEEDNQKPAGSQQLQPLHALRTRVQPTRGTKGRHQQQTNHAQQQAISIISSKDGTTDNDSDAQTDSFENEDDSGDSNWQEEENDQNRSKANSNQRSSLAAKQPARKRISHSSSNGGSKSGLSCSPRDPADDEPLADTNADDLVQQQPAKRRRCSHDNAGPEQQQQQQTDVAAKSLVQPPNASTVQQEPQIRKQPLQPGYVTCPVCGLSVKEAFINSHVDTCLSRADNIEQQPAVQAPKAATGAHKQRSAQQDRRPAVGPATAAAGSGTSSLMVGAAARRSRGRAAAVLEAPPKLCFELLKERDLKAKLSNLGLSNEGNKKACVDRYIAFRNYVLSLKDSGATSTTLKQAAAEFTQQEKRHARAAARPQSIGALAAAGQAVQAANGVDKSSRQQSCKGATAADNPEVLGLDNSYEALIRQTRERMQKRQQQQQHYLQDKDNLAASPAVQQVTEAIRAPMSCKGVCAGVTFTTVAAPSPEQLQSRSKIVVPASDDEFE